MKYIIVKVKKFLVEGRRESIIRDIERANERVAKEAGTYVRTVITITTMTAAFRLQQKFPTNREHVQTPTMPDAG